MQRRGLQLQAERDVVNVLDAYVDKTALANTVQNDFSVSSKVNRMRGYAQEGLSPTSASGNAPPTGGVLLFDVLSSVEEAGRLGQILKPVNQGIGPNAGLSTEERMKTQIRAILTRFEAQDRPPAPADEKLFG